jgi:hypothetical protein
MVISFRTLGIFDCVFPLDSQPQLFYRSIPHHRSTTEKIPLKINNFSITSPPQNKNLNIIEIISIFEKSS